MDGTLRVEVHWGIAQLYLTMTPALRSDVAASRFDRVAQTRAAVTEVLRSVVDRRDRKIYCGLYGKQADYSRFTHDLGLGGHAGLLYGRHPRTRLRV